MPPLTVGNRSIAGRVALVTGAAGGLGRAVAHLLADEGAAVAVTDRDGAAAEATAAEIVAAGLRARAYELDVTSARGIDVVVADLAATVGPVDILVNNAGVSLPAPIEGDEWEESWAATLAVNLTAQARLVRACLPHLARAGEGRVVNVASTEALGATPFLSAYTASKHGVIGLTRSLAVELGRRGVTVSCVCPGPIRTAMTAAIPDDAKATFARRRVPVGRYGEPEEVAHAVLGLVLPAMSYVNGAVLTVDGGMTAQNT